MFLQHRHTGRQIGGVFRGHVLLRPDADLLASDGGRAHKPLRGLAQVGQAQGQATDIQIQAERILQTKKSLNTILAERTGQPYEVICKDTERDNFMTAQEAVEYGLIDKVIYKR